VHDVVGGANSLKASVAQAEWSELPSSAVSRLRQGSQLWYTSMATKWNAAPCSRAKFILSWTDSHAMRSAPAHCSALQSERAQRCTAVTTATLGGRMYRPPASIAVHACRILLCCHSDATRSVERP
jgi:hypothetical protein